MMGVMSPLFEKVLAQSAAMGSLPTLRAAIDDDVDGADYFGPDGIGEMRGHPKKVDMTNRAKDEEMATKLWDVSAELSGVSYLDD